MKKKRLTNPTDRNNVVAMVTKNEISKVMATLGSRKTKAKAAASRQNGRKGGRPRKKAA